MAENSKTRDFQLMSTQHPASNIILTHGNLLGLLTVVLCLFLTAGLLRASLSADYRDYFDKDGEDLAAFNHLEANYGKQEIIFLGIDPLNGSVFERSVLHALQTITEELASIDYVQRVDSLSNHQYSYASDDSLVVEDFVKDVSTLSETDLLQLKSKAVNDPILVNSLISADGNVTGISVSFDLPGRNAAQEIPYVVSLVRERIDDWENQYALEIYLSGDIMLNNAFPEAALNDSKTLMPLLIFVIFFGLYVLYKKLPLVLACLVIVSLSCAASLGAIGWLGISIVPVTMIAPAMVMTISIASFVHIISTYVQQVHEGLDPDSALEETLIANLRPVTVAMGTTAFGFLVLNFSDAPPIRTMGNMVAIGIVLSLCLCLTLLPKAIKLYGQQISESSMFPAATMRLMFKLVRNHSAAIIVVSMIAITASLWLIPYNKLDDNPVEFYKSRVTFKADTLFIDEHLTGVNVLQYVLQSSDQTDINDPEYLRNLDKFASWLRSQSQVVHVVSYADIIKKISQDLHQNDSLWYKVPDLREQIAQYRLLYEMSLPQEKSLSYLLDNDNRSSRLSVSLHNVSSDQLIEFESKVSAWLKRETPTHFWTQATGPHLLFAHLTKRNIISLLKGTVLSLIVISMTLIILFRSLIIGALSLIPNIVPILMALATWVFVSGKIGVAASGVVVMVLGIVVDDTVHFISKYLTARKTMNYSKERALLYTFETVGSAIVLTTLILVAGFLVLTASPFTVNSDLGLLTAITLVFALLLDLTLLPALLFTLDRKPY